METKYAQPMKLVLALLVLVILIPSAEFPFLADIIPDPGTGHQLEEFPTETLIIAAVLVLAVVFATAFLLFKRRKK